MLRKKTVLFIILLIAAGIIGYMFIQTGRSGTTVVKAGKEYTNTINNFTEEDTYAYGFSSFTSGTYKVTLKAGSEPSDDFVDSFRLKVYNMKTEKTVKTVDWDTEKNGCTFTVKVKKMESYQFKIKGESYNDLELTFKIEKQE